MLRGRLSALHVCFRPVQYQQRFLPEQPHCVYTGYQPLRRRFLIAGASVDLPGGGQLRCFEFRLSFSWVSRCVIFYGIGASHYVHIFRLDHGFVVSVCVLGRLLDMPCRYISCVFSGKPRIRCLSLSAKRTTLSSMEGRYRARYPLSCLHITENGGGCSILFHRSCWSISQHSTSLSMDSFQGERYYHVVAA